MSNHDIIHLKKLYQIQKIFIQISIPYSIFISMIGIPGNIITIILLSKRSLTKNFNNCTLIALASTDLLFNLTLVSRCLSDSKLFSSISFCQTLAFLSHLAELLSACFTVHFTIQRFIAVRFPLSIFIEKNIHFIHYCIVTLFIILGISFCLTLVQLNLYEQGCQESLALKWFISDALLSFVIPFSLIATLNTLIIFHLRKTSQNNQQLSLRKQSNRNHLQVNQEKKYSFSNDSTSHSRIFDQSSGQNIRASISQYLSPSDTNDHFLSVGTIRSRTASIRSTTRYHAQSHHVTRMLILVSTCFLLLNAPSHICAIGFKLYTNRINEIILNNSYNLNLQRLNQTFNDNTSTIETDQRSILINWQAYQIISIFFLVTLHISYLSYSINFFLYSFCGRKFRSELMKFLSCCAQYRAHRRSTHTTRRASF